MLTIEIFKVKHKLFPEIISDIFMERAKNQKQFAKSRRFYNSLCK